MNSSNSRKKKRNVSNSSSEPDAKASLLVRRFAKAQAELNPRRQRLVKAILVSAEETCFLSSRELANLYLVDATTILRNSLVLCYKSYAEFSADLRQHFVSRITP